MNLTLSVSVGDEGQQKMAAAILGDAFDQLVQKVPGLTSLSLSLFDDELDAGSEAVGGEPPIPDYGSSDPPRPAARPVVDVEPRGDVL
jgi:hypothetical protein